MSIRPEEVDLNFVYKLTNALICTSKRDFWLRRCPEARSFLMDEKGALTFWLKFCPCLNSKACTKTLAAWVEGVEDGSVTECDLEIRTNNAT